MSSSRVYDKLLEKATSPLLLETDWESILKMCDLVRQADVQAKYALNQLKKKLANENMHVVLFSLNCVESLVKNCGSKVHSEVATKDFMDVLRNVAGTKSDPAKAKVLELIQCWSHAFKKNPNYRIVEDYFNAMKLEGFQFQPLKEADAMFDVEEAPAWKEDSEVTACFKCRVEFSALRRRHHCRACGQIFCNACSSKQSPIPKFGIEKEVRVCDSCFDKINRNQPLAPAGATNNPDEQLPIEYINSPLYKEAQLQAQQLAQQKKSSSSNSTSAKSNNEKTEQEFQDELNLALAISQSEAEFAEQAKRKKEKTKTSKKDNNESKQMLNQSAASAPSYNINENNNNNNDNKISNNNSVMNINSNESLSNNDEETRVNNEIDQFVEEVKKLLELFLNRMKSDSMRGRSIANDTAVQSLFLQLQHLHPKLLSYIKYQEDARAYYENLQDKLTQLKDAREALNALRMENYEKKRQEMEERERLRQMQIAQKLQFMRQQKQSYYMYQNQLNLQRLQEQERDFQMRLNQQRELVFKRDQLLNSNPAISAVSGVSALPYRSNGSSESFVNTMPSVLPGQHLQQGVQDANVILNNPALQHQQSLYPNASGMIGIGQQNPTVLQNAYIPNTIPYPGATTTTYPTNNGNINLINDTNKNGGIIANLDQQFQQSLQLNATTSQLGQQNILSHQQQSIAQSMIPQAVSNDSFSNVQYQIPPQQQWNNIPVQHYNNNNSLFYQQQQSQQQQNQIPVQAPNAFINGQQIQQQQQQQQPKEAQLISFD